MSKTRFAKGAIREFKRKTLKNFDFLGTGIGIGAGVALERDRANFEKRTKNRTKKCGKKYAIDPFKDSHADKMKKLRQFNKCRHRK